MSVLLEYGNGRDGNYIKLGMYHLKTQIFKHLDKVAPVCAVLDLDLSQAATIKSQRYFQIIYNKYTNKAMSFYFHCIRFQNYGVRIHKN